MRISISTCNSQSMKQSVSKRQNILRTQFCCYAYSGKEENVVVLWERKSKDNYESDLLLG